MKALKDSNLSISKRVRVIFGTSEESGIFGDVEHYLEKEAPPVSGFVSDGEFPAIYAEKGVLTFDMLKNLERVPSMIEIVSIDSGTAPNIVPNKALAEIRTSDPGSIVSECERFANEIGYNITAMQKNGSAMVTSNGLAAHGSSPYIVSSGPLMPEQIEVWHQPNEYIAISDLMNITRIYAQDIYELAK